MKKWEQIVYDFKCGKVGKVMDWRLGRDKKFHLFIDDVEIDLEEEI